MVTAADVGPGLLRGSEGSDALTEMLVNAPAEAVPSTVHETGRRLEVARLLVEIREAGSDDGCARSGAMTNATFAHILFVGVWWKGKPT